MSAPGPLGSRARPPASARLLRAGAEVLAIAGVDAPRLDAELLLAAAIGLPRFELLLEKPATVAKRERREFARLIRARALHEPVAYLLGFREFRDHRYRVDRRVLVPRPETEVLVSAALGWLDSRRARRPRVLELGCGSGCVAVSIAAACEEATVVATDASLEALEVARANVAALAPGRVELRAGDLFAAVAGESAFDLIVSNPPYVAADEIDAVDRGVRDFEPPSAWLSGADPLAFHGRILDEGARFLAAGGAIMLELGSGAERLARMATMRYPAARVAILPDLAGAPRVATIETSR